ncbi:hypothetical protein K438DRAFT_1788772 [Mycena galopus ATCC 62051]|nr:hypothetical protein K438DRAFT_1788772 [Mycena galopus ATCC 62051]
MNAANHEGAVGVFEGRVGGQDRVLRLDDRAGQLGRGVDTELELGLLAVVGRQPFEKERTENRVGSTSEGVEDKEAPETGAVVGKTADLVHVGIDELLTDSVVATGI